MKHPLKTLALSALAALTLAHATAQAQATETVSGTLEQNKSYLALFTVSEGSGDLIGYAIKAQTALGKAVLKHCLMGMPCRLDQARVRTMQDSSALAFPDRVSGWYDVLSASSAGLDRPSIEQQKTTKTRHGLVQIDSDNVLYFKGKPVIPAYQGNASLNILRQFSIKQQDVILLENTGGSACPAQFVFATVDTTGIRLTPEFGSCSEYYTVQQDSKTSVMVSIAKYNPATQTHKKEVFKYSDSKIIKQ